MKLTLLPTLALLLAACSPTFQHELDRKLDGKTADQKRAILAEECGEAIADSIRRAPPREHRGPEGMRRICEVMTGHKLP